MVKLVDTLASGASESNLLGVQVPFRAQEFLFKEMTSLGKDIISKY